MDYRTRGAVVLQRRQPQHRIVPRPGVYNLFALGSEFIQQPCYIFKTWFCSSTNRPILMVYIYFT